MENLNTFRNRLKIANVEIEMTANFPWVYLTKVNGNTVYDKFYAEHGFTIGLLVAEKFKFTDLTEIFNIIRKYK